MRRFKWVLTVVSLLAVFRAEAKLKIWDVGDYIQDGLVAHYDGIRNAGADKAHDPFAATWADISPQGAAGAASLVLDAPNRDGGSWTDKAYSFAGWSYFQMQNALALGLEFTVQVACDLDKSHKKENVSYCYLCPFASGEFGAYIDRSYEGACAKSNLVWKADMYAGAGRPSFNWENGSYFNFAMTSSDMYFTGGDQWPDAMARGTADVQVPALIYTFGGRYERNQIGRYCTKGDYYSVRVYSRKLEDRELKWNRMIDEIRFFGADILPVTNVVIVADVLGRSGAESAGAYMVDGDHVFTAGTVTSGGNTYRAVGYTVSEWDQSRNFWGEPVMHEGASYEYRASESSPKVRLMWIWRLISGIERINASHYIQNGLVANYDGIMNAGIAQEHDSTVQTWTDLARGDVGVLVQMQGGNEYGEWTDKGYDFKGYSYFETGNELVLGNEFTVQCVADMEMSHFNDDAHLYHTVWAGGDFSIYLDRSYASAIANTNLIWKDDMYSTGGNSSSRPSILSWDGRYVNAAFDASTSYMSQLTSLTTGIKYNTRERTNPIPVPALRYSWGGRYFSNSRYNMSGKGMFYAWRAYSRKLADGELAWNRDVDEVRFRNALPTFMSNAVVVASRDGSFVASEDGVYLLGGSYTFSAERKYVGTTAYAPCFTVEVWNGSEKKWEKNLKSRSSRCTLSEADSTSPRRIIWSWSKEGLSIVIR